MLLRSTTPVAAAVLSLMMFHSSTVHAALFPNGDAEDGNLTDFVNGSSGAGNSVTVVANPDPGFTAGGNYVFNITDTDSTDGDYNSADLQTYSQIQLNHSQSYLFQFEAKVVSGTPEVTLVENAGDIFSTQGFGQFDDGGPIALNSTAFSVTPVPNSNGWSTYSLRIGPATDSAAAINYQINAPSSYVRIEDFQAATPYNGAATGEVYADNFRIVAAAVPEPGTLALIAPLGVLAMRLRKTAAR